MHTKGLDGGVMSEDAVCIVGGTGFQSPPGSESLVSESHSVSQGGHVECVKGQQGQGRKGLCM